MRTADSHRERIADQLMEGETVAGINLHEILNDVRYARCESGQLLARIFKHCCLDRPTATDDVEDECRRIVERYVREQMDGEVRDRIDAEQEERRAA